MQEGSKRCQRPKEEGMKGRKGYIFGKFRQFSGRGKEILEVLGEIEEGRGKGGSYGITKRRKSGKGVEAAEVFTKHMKGLNMRNDVSLV